MMPLPTILKHGAAWSPRWKGGEIADEGWSHEWTTQGRRQDYILLDLRSIIVVRRILYNDYHINRLMRVRVMVETEESTLAYPTRATPARCGVHK
jgi:hypothetical protein